MAQVEGEEARGTRYTKQRFSFWRLLFLSLLSCHFPKDTFVLFSVLAEVHKLERYLLRAGQILRGRTTYCLWVSVCVYLFFLG